MKPVNTPALPMRSVRIQKVAISVNLRRNVQENPNAIQAMQATQAIQAVQAAQAVTQQLRIQLRILLG